MGIDKDIVFINLLPQFAELPEETERKEVMTTKNFVEIKRTLHAKLKHQDRRD